MKRLIATSLLTFGVMLTSADSSAAEKPKGNPNITESKEYKGVYLSPTADSTPSAFRSIFQMEIVVRHGGSEAQIVYANGTVVGPNGLVVSVMAAPHQNSDPDGGIVSASMLTLDGSGVPAELLAYDPAYGVAVFRTEGLNARPLPLSKVPLVANRRVMWHAVFRDGRKTYLYRRPLHVHKAAQTVGETKDLCEFIDHDSSSLNAERSGSALIALDGSVLGLMGRQKHWNVSPKNVQPRTKVAWAVPAEVIARVIDQAKPSS